MKNNLGEVIYPSGGTPSEGILIVGSDGTNTQVIKCNANGELAVNLEVAEIQIGAVELKDADTEARQSIKVDNETASATPTVAITGAHYKATPATYDDNDATPLHADINGNLKVNVVAASTDSVQTSNLNPEWAHYTCVEHIVDEVNLAAGDNYIVIDMEGYRNAALQILGSGGVTFTAYITLSEDASDTDETDTQWVDATSDLFGTTSIVDTGAISFIDTSRMPKKIMIKYVTSDATNAIDVWSRKY